MCIWGCVYVYIFTYTHSSFKMQIRIFKNHLIEKIVTISFWEVMGWCTNTNAFNSLKVRNHCSGKASWSMCLQSGRKRPTSCTRALYSWPWSFPWGGEVAALPCEVCSRLEPPSSQSQHSCSWISRRVSALGAEPSLRTQAAVYSESCAAEIQDEAPRPLACTAFGSLPISYVWFRKREENTFHSMSRPTKKVVWKDFLSYLSSVFPPVIKITLSVKIWIK